MANIRAGVAYVDVRLGSIDDLKNKIKAGIEDIGKSAGKQLGDNIKKSTPTAPIAELGQKLDKELSQAFFKDAKQEFGGGLRALATGQFGTAKSLFAQAGRDFGTVLSNGFNKASNAIGNGLRTIVSSVSGIGPAIGNAFNKAWTKAQEFGQVLDKAAQKMGFLSFQIQNFGIIASAVFTAPIAGALTFGTVIGIKTAAQIESATAALKFLLPVGYNVEALLNRLKKIAIESPIFDTADLIQYTQKFVAAGVSVDKTTRFLAAFSNIALVTGASTDEANRAITAITQVFGKGKLQAEELNQQLGEAMPAVLKLLRDQFGVTQKELTKMVKEGKISGDDLIKAFTNIGESSKFLNGAAHGAETLNGVWQNFKETLQTQLGQFFLDNAKQIKEGISQLGPALSQLIKDAGPAFLALIDAFTKLVGYFKQAVDWYSKLSPGTQDLILKLVAFGAAIGPVVFALGSLAGAFAGVVAGIAALLTPVGLVVAAIVLVGVAVAGIIIWFKKFGGESSALGKTLSGWWDTIYKNVLTPIGHAFQDLWKQIKEAFTQIKNAVGGNTSAWKTWGGNLKTIWEGLKAIVVATVSALVVQFKGILTVLGYVIKAIASIISGIIKIFKGWTDFLAGVFSGDWNRALRGLLEVWNGIWDLVYGTLANLSKALGNLVITIYKTIVTWFKKLYDTLVGHSIIPDMVRAIISWFQKLTAPIRAVLSAIGSLFTGFGSKLKAFANLFAQGVRDANAYFASLPGKIKSALSNLASTLYNFGANAMQGFVNGLASIGSRAIDKARDIANSVKNIVGNVLGIHSPSRVFREYGRNVVQGFVLGISGEQSQLAKSLSVFGEKPRFEQINGSPAQPVGNNSPGAALTIENYYANDNVDPWRQAEDWYFLVTSRGGVA